MTKNIQHQ